MRKFLILLLILPFLTSCALLTGSRACQCEHNTETGLTKWSCESGAISESAMIQFGKACSFSAGAQGARQGRSAIDVDQLTNALVRGLLRQPVAPEPEE